MASLAQNPPTRSTAVPLTQNTAPVIEFRCMFTSDIRRKQKRWQDGRLKFHTFNKRVMVYDERLNFVGDTHWHDHHIDEGEELELDRAAVLVQVADCLGSRDQDLTELLDKRMKQREERAAVRRPSSSPADVPFDNLRIARQPTANSKQLQKPLSALLGTPTGHHGRALLPTTSPFEDRQKELRQDRETQERPSKRRKAEPTYSKAGYAQNLTGAMLDLSSTPHSTAPFRREPLWSRTSRRQEGNEISKEDFHSTDLISREFQEPPRQERRQRELPEKKAKSGFAQNLTGAVLDLSSTQNTNAFLRHHPPSTSITERDSTEKNRLGIGEHEGLRSEPVLPRVLQAPLTKKHSTNQTKSKRGEGSLNNTTRNISVGATKVGKPMPSREQQRDVPSASDEFPAINDEFIDIEDIEPASRTPNPIIIDNTNKSRQGSSDLHAIAISPSPEVPPPVAIAPIVVSEASPDVTNGPPETVGSIRLKSRPKRKMLVLNDSRPAQPPSIQAIPRPVPPTEDIAPEQSQATKKLDEFHARQKEQLRARSVKRKSALYQDDDGISESSNTSDGFTSALPSMSNISVPKGAKISKASLSRQPQAVQKIQHVYPTAVEEPLLLPTRGTTGQISRQSPDPSIPQSSEPAFELLQSVADRMASSKGLALQTATKPYVPIIPEPIAEVKVPQTSTAEVKAPQTRTGRRRSEAPSSESTATTTNISSPKDVSAEVAPKRPQITKAQLLKTSKTARSKIVVGWAGPAKEPIVIQARPTQAPQMREVNDVSQAGAQPTVVAQELATSRAVSAKAQPLHDVPLRRRPVARKSAGDVAERGGSAARSDSGPWSREAFDLFDWRPDEIG
ncbi:hypothetical protein V490_08602 [Pseudogymnoascus sp. VKM F-3557]|nr:hypothetical protein V490_08602 [Pseudogymnoascus sp. VKM F-3557]